MPIPIPLIGAAISGATSLAGNLIQNNANNNQASNQQNWNQNMQTSMNAWNQMMWNQQNKYNEGRYAKERQDMLDFWNMQNEYNSPQAQMARFREAGLNPHLIYGQGNAGNASTISNPSGARAESIKSADIKGYNRPQMESVTRGMDVFGDYTRFKQIQAQTDNLEAQNNVIKQESLLKAQQTAAEALKVDRGKFDYGIAKELRETSVEAAKVNLEQQKSNLKKTDVNINRDKLQYQIEQDLKDPRIREAYLKVESLVKSNTGKDLANALQREQLQLAKRGVTNGDSIIWRALIQNWGDIYKFLSSPEKTKGLMESIQRGIIDPIGLNFK